MFIPLGELQRHDKEHWWWPERPGFPFIYNPSICESMYIVIHVFYMWTYCWVSPLPARSVSSLQSPPVVASGSTHPSSHARCSARVLHTHKHTHKISVITVVADCCPSTNELHIALGHVEKYSKSSTTYYWKTILFLCERNTQPILSTVSSCHHLSEWKC